MELKAIHYNADIEMGLGTQVQDKSLWEHQSSQVYPQVHTWEMNKVEVHHNPFCVPWPLAVPLSTQKPDPPVATQSSVD